MTCKERILSEEYGEVILDFTFGEGQPEFERQECYTRVDEKFEVLYLPLNRIAGITGSLYTYQYLPGVYGLMADNFNTLSLTASGILQTQRPPLSLKGKGVIIAFVDTGILYENEVFMDQIGESRILAIWDQTIQTGTAPEGYHYGSLYTREDINEALRSDNPREVVPSTDEIGHGTAMASVAAGSIVDGGRTFVGAAPEADIVVVKLRQAKQYLRDYYFLDSEVPAYAESDIMLGIKFAESFAIPFERPVVICLGLGNNFGNHTLGSSLSQYLNRLSTKRARGIVVCGGNEGNAAHHFSGRVEPGPGAYENVEIRVGEGERGFLMEMWGKVPDVLYASLRTPGGEVIPRFRLGFGQSLVYRFVYERTVVNIDSILVEPNTGEELIVFRFDGPTPGVWSIQIYAGDDRGSNTFNCWLPIRAFLQSETYFLRPDPYTTITDPGISLGPITISAYNEVNNSFYVESGRGFLANGLVKPDLAAVGVDVPTVMGNVTGSSIACAIAAGGIAQFYEWAVLENNINNVSSQETKSYFIRGAKRSVDITYPNPEWGYGRFDVAGTFEALSVV